MVRYANLAMITEVRCFPGENVRPADIFIFDGPNGVPLAIDITVVSPLCSVYIDPAHDLSTPAANVNAAERIKIKKYAHFMKDRKNRLTFMPFGISTFGSLGSSARKVLAFLVKETTRSRLIPSEIAAYYISRILIGTVFQQIGMAMSQDLAML